MSRRKQSLMGNLPSGGSWRLVSSVDGLEAVEGAFVNAKAGRDTTGWASLGQGVVLRRNQSQSEKIFENHSVVIAASFEMPKGWTVTH